MLIASPRCSARAALLKRSDHADTEESFAFQGARKLELLVDVFNVLNKSTPQRVLSTNLSSANFGVERRPIDPRRAMVGVKIIF